MSAARKRVVAITTPDDAPQLMLVLDAPKPAPALGSTTLPRARRTDRATSHRATVAAARGITDKQLAVLAVMSVYAPLTDEALVSRYRAWQTGMAGGRELPDLTDSSIRTRRSELVTLDMVRDSGQEGKTQRGGAATVWELTAAGDARAAQQ